MIFSKYLCPKCLKSFKGQFGSDNKICGTCGSRAMRIHYSLRVPKVSSSKYVWKKFLKSFFVYCERNKDCIYQKEVKELFKKFKLPITKT